MTDETMAIRGFHAHVYYDPTTRATAAQVRDELAARFEVELGRWLSREYLAPLWRCLTMMLPSIGPSSPASRAV